MKAIMISIRPQYVAKILNGEKTIEIRKRFPSDYVGWVYIYVTKALPHLSKTYVGDYEVYDDTQWDKEWLDLNGKVVARFWCDKVEEIKFETAPFDSNLIHWETKTLSMFDINEKSCLTEKELLNYLKEKSGYAIHITKLEIFDRPKEISEFSVPSHKVDGIGYNGEEKTFRILKPLTRAPQNYCYIEV